MITGGTGRFVNSLTDFWAISFQDDWGVTEGFSFFYHYNFVDTSFTSSSNGSNVKSDIIVSTASLTCITNVIYGVMSMMLIMVSSMMISMVSCWLTSSVSGVKWESTTKVLTGTLAKSACS